MIISAYANVCSCSDKITFFVTNSSGSLIGYMFYMRHNYCHVIDFYIISDSSVDVSTSA